ATRRRSGTACAPAACQTPCLASASLAAARSRQPCPPDAPGESTMPAPTFAAWTRARRTLGPAMGAVGLAVATILGCASPGPAAVPPAKPAPAAAQQAPVAQATEPLRIVYLTTGKTWSQVPLLVAEQQGYFAAEHLDVEINFGGQSSTVCQSLSSRSVDM